MPLWLANVAYIRSRDYTYEYVYNVSLIFWRLIVLVVPVGPPQTYLTLTLRNLGFTTTQPNLLTLPSTTCGLLTLLITSYLAEFIHSRVGACLILQIWTLPLLIVLRNFGSSTNQWDYFAVVTLITGFPYVHPIQVGWASRNSGSVRTRTISASVYNMFVQAGVIVYVSTIGIILVNWRWQLLGEYISRGRRREWFWVRPNWNQWSANQSIYRTRLASMYAP